MADGRTASLTVARAQQHDRVERRLRFGGEPSALRLAQRGSKASRSQSHTILTGLKLVTVGAVGLQGQRSGTGQQA